MNVEELIRWAHAETGRTNDPDVMTGEWEDKPHRVVWELTDRLVQLLERNRRLADRLDQEAATVDDPKAVGIWPRTREGMANISTIREQYRAAQCNHVSINLRSIAAALRTFDKCAAGPFVSRRTARQEAAALNRGKENE